MGEVRNAHKILVGKSEGKRSLGRPRHSLEDVSCLRTYGIIVL
jgi:hypothetical protein